MSNVSSDRCRSRRPFRFLTNHGLVLLCVAEDPRIRMREIAARLQITERAAQRIISDLIEAGYVTRSREGRRNTYSVRFDVPIVLPSDRDVDLRSLLEVLLPSAAPSREEMVDGAPTSGR
jgi:DNA-binding transcriptional ArsR family regulator